MRNKITTIAFLFMLLVTISINLLPLNVEAAPDASCPQVIADTATSIAAVPIKVGAAEKFYQDNFVGTGSLGSVGTIFSRDHPGLQTLAAAAYSELGISQQKLNTFSSNDCGEPQYNSLRGDHVRNVSRYNTFAQSYNNGPYWNSQFSKIREFEVQTLTYSPANSAQRACIEQLSKVAQKINEAEAPMLAAEQYGLAWASLTGTSKTPAAIQERDTKIEAARTAWKAALAEKETALSMGCDKSATVEYNKQNASVQQLYTRLNAAETALGVDATSYTATVLQTATNVANMLGFDCAACKDLASNTFYDIINKMVQGLCCFMYTILNSMREILKAISDVILSGLDYL